MRIFKDSYMNLGDSEKARVFYMYLLGFMLS
jgi:hypothetical protein